MSKWSARQDLEGFLADKNLLRLVAVEGSSLDQLIDVDAGLVVDALVEWLRKNHVEVGEDSLVSEDGILSLADLLEADDGPCGCGGDWTGANHVCV